MAYHFKVSILLLFVTYLILLSASAYGQETQFGLRLNRLSTHTEEEVINVDTLLILPTELINRKAYDIDLFVRYEITPSVKAEARIGFISETSQQQFISLRDNGNRGYANGYSISRSAGFRLAFGLQKEILSKAQLVLSCGANLHYSHLISRPSKYRVDYYNEQSQYEYSQEESTKAPDTQEIGGALNVNAYYWFFNRLGIGLELDPRIRYQWQAGEVYERPRILDESGNILSSIELYRERTLSRTSIGTNISIGLQYKIIGKKQ